MKEIGCLGKYVDTLDSSHLETTEDTESHYLSFSSSLLTSITRESLLYSMQMLFHPFLFDSIHQNNAYLNIVSNIISLVAREDWLVIS